MKDGIMLVRKSSVLAFSLAAILGASSLALAGKKNDAASVQPYDFSADPASQSSQYVKLERGGNYKKIKKLGIVNFSVEFALERQAKTPGAGGSIASVEMEIPQPSVAELQSIVNDLYRDVQKDFESQGIEIIPFEKISATKKFQKLKGAQHESPWVTEMKNAHSIFVAPTGMPIYLDNPERATLLKQLGFAFGTNTRMHEILMVHELKGNTNLVSVNMVVDFATLSMNRNKTKIEYRSDVHHLHAGDSFFRFVSNTQPEFMFARLSTPLVSDKPLFSDIEESMKKSRESNMDNSVTKREETSTTATFDMDGYYKKTRELLDAARKMFAAELASQR